MKEKSAMEEKKKETEGKEKVEETRKRQLLSEEDVVRKQLNAYVVDVCKQQEANEEIERGPSARIQPTILTRREASRPGRNSKSMMFAFIFEVI